MHWKNTTFEIELVEHDPLWPVVKDEVTGWVSFPFACRSDPNDGPLSEPLTWTLTHLPTGRSIQRGLKDRETCFKMAEDLVGATEGGKATWAHPDPVAVADKLQAAGKKVIHPMLGKLRTQEESIAAAKARMGATP